MKRVFTILLLLFISLAAFSQSTSRVVRVEIKTKTDSGLFEDYKTTYPTDMYLTMKGKVITVSNKTESRYTTYGSSVKRNGKNYRETEWTALDEEGVKCLVSLIYYTDGTFVVFVYYTNLIVIYELKD